MLKQLRNIHAGKSIAVLGSGDSLGLFKRQQGIVIGVNGARSMLKKGDYFLSNDESAHKQPWLPDPKSGLIMLLPPITAMYIPAMYPDPVQQQSLIRAYENLLHLYPDSHKPHVDGTPVVVPGHPVFDAMFENFPLPTPPHYIFRRIVYEGQVAISREQEAIIKRGTSACVGVQIAYIMGASEIHLYGVDWSNSSDWKKPGQKYSPLAINGKGGVTTDAQLVVMDSVVQAIREQGTPVYSHGPTRLTQSIHVD